jgi:lipopolysaccharide transport system permease protein
LTTKDSSKKVASFVSDKIIQSSNKNIKKPSVFIDAEQSFFHTGLRDLWKYRELLLARFPSDGLPFPIFAYSALVPWFFFSKSVTSCSLSIVSNDNLIKKIYFPRLILPLSSILTNVVDFLLSFFILLGLMVWYNISLTLNAFAVLFFLIDAIIVSLALGLWFAALNVKYRDINHIIPFLLQLWLYLTPNFYPVSLVPEKWLPFYMLNPMVGVVEGFRWALLNKPVTNFTYHGISLILVLILLLTGLFYFKNTEKTFADVI